jgi:hypothetical protein
LDRVRALKPEWETIDSYVPYRRTIASRISWITYTGWQQQNVAASAFAEIPEAKIRQFAAEARSLDLTSLNDMPERKHLTLAGALILKQVARALDDVTDMFIRQVKKMHHKAEEALMQYQIAHADRTDALIAVLRDITLAYKAEGSREERLARRMNLSARSRFMANRRASRGGATVYCQASCAVGSGGQTSR